MMKTNPVPLSITVQEWVRDRIQAEAIEKGKAVLGEDVKQEEVVSRYIELMFLKHWGVVTDPKRLKSMEGAIKRAFIESIKHHRVVLLQLFYYDFDQTIFVAQKVAAEQGMESDYHRTYKTHGMSSYHSDVRMTIFFSAWYPENAKNEKPDSRIEIVI